MELEEAQKIADGLLLTLMPYCKRVTVAGSIRRRKPEVGDIEILAIPRYSVGTDLLDREIKNLIEVGILDYRLNKLGRRVYGPKNKLLVHVQSGIGVDVFSTTEDCWPVALVVRTGGKVTNRKIAMAAIAKGWRFHAYGRGFTDEHGNEIVCHSEREVFELVGLPYKEPWERE